MPKVIPLKNRRICPKCKSRFTVKEGIHRGKQKYSCKDCKHVFVSKSNSKLKEKKKIDEIKYIWNQYSNGKQTYKQLAEVTGYKVGTIQKRIDAYILEERKIEPSSVFLLIDTSFFGSFGIMGFRDQKSKTMIKCKIVEKEDINIYYNTIKELKQEGWNILGIVCDGKKGLLGGFGIIPTQMCQFHQIKIIERYITKNPILQANKDLKFIVSRLTKTDKQSFELWLEEWFIKNKEFLSEKTYGNDGRYTYTHNRTRSAYFSLKNNLKYLFIYHDFIDLGMPNTTNSLESTWGHVGGKLNNHRGLKRHRKEKLIMSLLMNN